MAVRIQLKPGLQLLRRGPSTVQIGLDGRHGTVLDGLEPADVELLRQLIDGLDDSALSDPADERPGHPAVRARRLVNTLAGAGVLLRSRSGRAALALVGEHRARLTPDAAAWSLIHPHTGDGWELIAARRRRTVEIRGAGRTGTALAAMLAATGVGRVVVDDDTTTSPADLLPGGAQPSDVGRPRAQAARRAVDRALGRTDPADPADPEDRADAAGPADLVVLVDLSAADATRADRLLAGDIPHLSVVIRETSVIVGPLVRPGRGPCLRCLELHRSERDRQWPLVLAQLLSRGHRRAAPREESALAQLAASLVTLQVLGHLDGQAVPAAVGATLEVELPDGLISRRPWPAHSACGCHWPPGPATHPVLVQDAQDGSAPATMLS